jgi:hypothetical protein
MWLGHCIPAGAGGYMLATALGPLLRSKVWGAALLIIGRVARSV